MINNRHNIYIPGKKEKKTNNVNLLRQISFMNKVSIKIMTSYLNMISCYKNGVLH